MLRQEAPAGFRNGLASSLPIVAGYFPIAFSFGVAASKAGLAAHEATFLSLVIYAGAAQFISLALLTGGASIWVSIATLLAMNLRHLLYAPSLLDLAGSRASTRFSWAWAFGLTDEVFAASVGSIATHPNRWSERWMLGIALAAYSSWVIGTAIGAAVGGRALEAYPAIDAALGFMLPALFLSLLLSILSKAQIPIIAVAALVCALVTVTVSGTAGILAGMIAGALAGVLRGRRNADQEASA